MTKQQYYLLIVSLFLGVPAIIYLFIKDWRLALAIFLFVWSNNISVYVSNKH